MVLTMRHPAVAGRFYPGDRQVLLSDIESYASPREKTIKAALYEILKDESEVERIFLVIRAQREY